MKIKIIFPCIIIFTQFAFSQQLSKDSLDVLFYNYLKAEGHKEYLPSGISIDTTKNIKCGFGIAAEVFIHFNEFTEAQKRILKILLTRPVTDTSIVSQSGFFRIHFNISGFDKPTYSVTDFARALDSAYNFEVNYLGYPPPPPDTINGVSPADAGGDGKLDVYIVDLGGYGETDFETQIAPGIYTSYIQVHYSFGSGFYTHGIDAARVTAAHEFHHTIQVGNYIFRDSDRYFHELTSVSMEEFVFNTVNDYYGYLDYYFRHPEIAFAANDGYDIAIWNIFLKDEFGFDIIKRQWELMPSKRAVDAINTSLLEKQSSFGKELNTFGIWTYYTGYRALPGKYFSEGANYPLVIEHSFEINTPLNLNDVKPTSNNHLTTVSQNLQDTLSVILTNTDYVSGIDSLYKNFSAVYNLFNYNSPGSTKLDTNYYEELNVDNSSLWLSSVILNGILVKQDSTIYQSKINSLSYAYPNPFRYNHYARDILYIPVEAGIFSNVILNVYSPSMNLIFSESLPVTVGENNEPVINWNLDAAGKKLQSGVYIYVTRTRKKENIGKLVIIQ